MASIHRFTHEISAAPLRECHVNRHTVTSSVVTDPGSDHRGSGGAEGSASPASGRERPDFDQYPTLTTVFRQYDQDVDGRLSFRE
jgi:hypothetical protein